MGWTAPSTFTVGQLVTAATLNTTIRDNINYLRGLAGAVNILSPLGLSDIGADITPSTLLHVHSTSAATTVRLS